MQHEDATEATPGRVWIRCTPSRTSRSTSEVFSKRSLASDICMTSTLWESKPGLTECNATYVRISNAAPTNSISASATSPITSSARLLFWRKSLPDRLLLSFSAVQRSKRDDWSAGTRPKSTAVTSETTHVKVKTRQSAVTAES